ncbi:MAG TPA: endo-1,4-beta-xylanase [Isosphaeraceae bacterium]|nr:endo-1,4-beta-xylanase [Isosphaeraceae bacterium]
MGVIKFRLPSGEAAQPLPDYRTAYITGLDRTPGRVGVDLRNGLMTCVRDTTESGRLFVPWPIEGQGMPIIGTATLAERPTPYVLAVELARGRLNDVRNQLADWIQMGLRSTPELEQALDQAQRDFIRAATSPDRPEVCHAAAQSSLRWASEAGDLLMAAYTAQVFQSRLASTSKLPTLLGCVLDYDPLKVSPALEWPRTFNACQLSTSWKQMAPTEGQYRWDLFDAQLAWCRRNRLAIEAGPLIEFRKGALPDWLWLWEGDFETITGLVVDFVRQAVTRYRGKVPLWQVVHRPASGEVLGLTEEEQVRIAARAVQIARQTDPSAQLIIGVDRPWAEWMGTSHFQLGPLHLCDYLLRAELGISGVAIEIAPGYSAPGSHLRDLFEFSKLLDLYSLLNVPLHLVMVVPSAGGPDPLAEPDVRIESSQWPAPPDEAMQAGWGARWIALAVAKPFVRTVSWLQSSDAVPHLYPHGGLVRPDQAAKPLVAWLQALRAETLT